MLIRRENILPGTIEETSRGIQKLCECMLHFTDEDVLCEIVIFLANLIFLDEYHIITQTMQ